MGGAFGEVHGAKLIGLLRAARELEADGRADPVRHRRRAPAGGQCRRDSPSPRPCGRCVEARAAGVAGHRADRRPGRLLRRRRPHRRHAARRSPSRSRAASACPGPEVIETNKGVEEFDSRDRALVWRTMGGKHRRLIGGADAFCDDTVDGVPARRRSTLIGRAPAFDLATPRRPSRRGSRRGSRASASAATPRTSGRALGVNDPEAVPGHGRATPSTRLADARGGGRIMTLAEILRLPVPGRPRRRGRDDGLVTGSGRFEGGRCRRRRRRRRHAARGRGRADPLRARAAIAVRTARRAPILVLVDSDSQRMSRRDELLGLNEFLAHLAKALILADLSGHPTIGLLYGHSAAGRLHRHRARDPGAGRRCPAPSRR